MNYKQLLSLYRSKFTTEPRIFRSPGRINIIGEHTDYNDGFVLPAGVDKEICMLMARNGSDNFSVFSCDTDEQVSFNLTNYKNEQSPWAQYIIGVVDQMVQMGYQFGGFDSLFSGDIPMGAGMSSSAALECVTAFGMNSLFELGINKEGIAKLAQRAENQYVGVNCGIMDQFASVFSEKNHALKLDCRNLTFETYSLDLEGYQLVLVDSMVKHALATSEYNVRRAECEEGVKFLQQIDPNIKALRDATIEQVIELKKVMPANVFDRCKYMVEEIARVSAACKAMESNNFTLLGELLYATHHGLQHEFKISCDELDFLVDFTRDKDQVLGARMMGGGFGGCSINLVEESYIEQFKSQVSDAYIKQFAVNPSIYLVKTAEGSSEILLDTLVNSDIEMA